MPQYRLASDSSTRFPAAMQDGLTAYMYLLGQGVSPRDIVLSGDSAGANLVVALVRYLTEEKGFLPLPRVVIVEPRAGSEDTSRGLRNAS